ncbi:type II secretion system protein N [Inhella sp. 4Y17]|uniref:Type II secretion system protein N n=2 Tax=Inhella gelatinilytica TaxID=2795030 RepID=A0A931NCU9_9BURK|nr:type II secretion system protein N [Inhella gelatinilytica]
MAPLVGQATQERLLLSETQGSLWQGEARLVLTGGAGSQESSQLPGALSWRWGWEGGPRLRIRLDGHTPGFVPLAFRPGWRQWRVSLPASPEPLLRIPAIWLKGLGTPWNTLLLQGELRLSAPGAALQWRSGQGTQWVGPLQLDAVQMASAVSPLPTLGDYRLTVQSAAQGPALLQLSTLSGALQLQGSGQWLAGHLSFQGDARAAPGAESSLNNLLNIIGRRQGERSVITIGS